MVPGRLAVRQNHRHYRIRKAFLRREQLCKYRLCADLRYDGGDAEGEWKVCSGGSSHWFPGCARHGRSQRTGSGGTGCSGCRVGGKGAGGRIESVCPVAGAEGQRYGLLSPGGDLPAGFYNDALQLQYHKEYLGNRGEGVLLPVG